MPVIRDLAATERRTVADRQSREDVEGQLERELDAERPGELESWRFARKILPVFRHVRTLFSRNRLNTALKLMLLYELTRIRGRFDKGRMRSAMP